MNPNSSQGGVMHQSRNPGGLSRAVTLLLLLAGTFLAAGAESARTDSNLGERFLLPPDTARPWVYWFWLDGNVTKEGITADLEAMRRVGLGGALWMWGGGVGEGVKGPVKFVRPEWWEMMRHTIKEADRLGLKLNITAGSGWSHTGGPWIRPEHSMRKLELTQTFKLEGGTRTNLVLTGEDPLVAVMAHPLEERQLAQQREGGVLRASSTAPGFPLANAQDLDVGTRWISRGERPGDGPTAEHPAWLDFDFPRKFAAAALFVVPFQDCGPKACEIQVSDDGNEYQTILGFELAANTPRTLQFPTTSARHFRLRITSSYPFQGQASWNVQIAEAQLLAAGEEPVGKGRLESRRVVELTGKVKAGQVEWEAPPGKWVVQVLRHRSTGDTPHPILPDEGGLECDKLSFEAVDAHWEGYIQRLLEEGGPAARRVIGWAHADSYEFGPQTWTPRFREQFRERCGYDPLPYLPAVLGIMVDDETTTRRFLWDFRRVRADLFAEAIGGRLREKCQEAGLGLTTEPHLVPEVFDQVQYGGHVSEPVGNFLGERRTAWYAPNPPVGPEVHLAKGEASSAYTYGLNGVIWAEAFTGTDHAHAWQETPAYLKTWGDLWLTEGINRFVFHCWAHSPSLSKKPGITLGPWGIHFDRRNTWFELGTGYVTYLSRAQFLLQQGLPVTDVGFFTGDGVVAEFPRHPELRAAGYDYHGITAEILHRAKVENGEIVLPSGMRYRLLVTYSREMRAGTLRKLRELVQAGATVLGVRPEDAPGLTGYPQSVNEVRQTADEMWGHGHEEARTGRALGKGKVFEGKPEGAADGTSGCGVAVYLNCSRELEVLRQLGCSADFEYERSGKEDCDSMLAYMHRRSEQADWYFVSNQAGRSRAERCWFRVTGRAPEIWDAVTGEIRPLPVYRQDGGRTEVPLEFAAGQAFFVVFRKPAGNGTSAVANFPVPEPLREIAGPWKVTFDPQWGGPKNPVAFPALEDWSRSGDPGIKYYSGTAGYRTQFEWKGTDTDRRVYLDLGTVRDLGEVRLNGESAGIAWCAPWRVEVTRHLRAGTNELEIVVANQWVNRLIGDAGQPEAERFTWTTWNPYKPNSPLKESGLLGPVRLLTSE